MINKKWCDPRNISILSRSCSPHLEHLSIICRPFYLPREFLRGHRYCRLHSTSADKSLALSKLHEEISGYINKHPDAASIIAGDFNKANLRKVMRTSISMYPAQLEDRIHWIIATLSSRMPIKLVPCRLLVNRTTRPFSSHRNINKGLFRNPRG